MDHYSTTMDNRRGGSMNPKPAAPITDYLNSEDIVIPLKAGSSEEACRLLIDRLHRSHGGFDQERAVQAVLAREAVMPVVMERELAMPHGRLADLARPRIAVGVCPAGLAYPGAEAPVRVIVLTLVPLSEPNLYLRVLAAVSKSLRVPGTLDRIVAAKSPDGVLAALGISHEHLPEFLAVKHLMNTNPVVLRDTDTLGDAIELISAKAIMDLPIVNAQGEVLGTIAIEDLLRLCLPAHLRWMEDLSPILRFEPFAELVKRDSGLPITRFMREDILSIGPDVPAIQLAKLFLLDERRQVVVLDNRRLIGTADLTSYVRKLFWD
jgi:mannitol/fructose-specific phosphotransferase system IIA component (Ntr-type)/predicted transcriptional regulator